jgi:hypothetical protein
MSPATPAGYSHLVRVYKLRAMPHWHESAIGSGAAHRIEERDGIVRETYPAVYAPGESLGDQLDFALKYDGLSLNILAELFGAVPAKQVSDYVRSKPTGKYARRIWFLYEWMTGERLAIPDLTQGNYIDLLDANSHFVGKARSVARQRIRDNLLGTADFCPIVRRTPKTDAMQSSAQLLARCEKLLKGYSPTLLRRALAFLYTKETKSSFEIEHVKPKANRVERFTALLQLAERDDFLQPDKLVELQNAIVDERFAAKGFRTNQNYVGESVSLSSEVVHFVSPKPADLAGLMDGVVATHERLAEAEVHPIVHAAVIAYAFVFMHPFEDGNGRIHRFLIHNILARRGVSPRGLIFPISATMLKQPQAYDASLEAFSKPLMQLIDYRLDDRGKLTVDNDTQNHYRFIDLTSQVEALHAFVQETIEVELVQELQFLASYDAAKTAIQELVDMPDRQIDLFIRLCLQHKGHISATKRRSVFGTLTSAEIAKLEGAVRSNYPPESFRKSRK